MKSNGGNMIIGINGKAGSGKDTVGDYLCEKYGFRKDSLAAPLKTAVQTIFNIDDFTMYDRDEREKELNDWEGWSVRKLLQYVGTEMFRNMIVDNIWVKSLWLRNKDHGDNIVVSDCRFPNEVSFLKKKFGDKFISIKVERNGYIGVNVGINAHASESFDLDCDYKIENNGTIEELYLKVDQLFVELNRRLSRRLRLWLKCTKILRKLRLMR